MRCETSGLKHGFYESILVHQSCSNCDRNPARKIMTKKGDKPPKDNSAHDRHGDKPDEARDRTPARTNPHHTTNQPRNHEGKRSSTTTRSKTAPDNRTRERTRRRTQQPRTATTRKSQTNHTTEGNGQARNRRARTNREGKTHEKKPPKGHDSVVVARA